MQEQLPIGQSNKVNKSLRCFIKYIKIEEKEKEELKSIKY